MSVTSLLVEKYHHFVKITPIFGQRWISFNSLILKDSSTTFVKRYKRFLMPKLVKENIVDNFD